MIGWINESVASFIINSFGEDKWHAIVAESGVAEAAWVSSCAYADKVTYDLVITGARILGVTVDQALEAYGVYFVKYTAEQGYTKLLTALGSNIVEFLSNLNSLHLHLTSTFPAMRAPAFRCDKVTPESCELHYYSHRPALWPIVVGVLKGLAREYWKFEITIELLQARGTHEGADHEVFLITYPYQQSLARPLSSSADAASSSYTLPPRDFHTLHPFHLLIDAEGRLVKCGDGLRRLYPAIQQGMPLSVFFTVTHPFLSRFSLDAIHVELHTSFLLRSTQPPDVTLKGQMVLTRLSGVPGAPGSEDAVLFLGTPRCANLDELQNAQLFLSDFPLHDMGRDFVLLAEQRMAEAELKERFEKLTLEMKAEKARSDALVQRMSVLLACFPFKEQGKGSNAASGDNNSLVDSNQDIDHVEVIEAVRRAINPQLGQRNTTEDEIHVIQALSEGSYGKVYKGLWHGTEVAVKMMVLPANMSGAEKREKMAIMEAAISSTLSHPNIVQTYTYTIRPVRDSAAPALESRNKEDLFQMGIKVGSEAATATMGMGAPFRSPDESGFSNISNMSATGGIHSYEVRLVLELCDLGSLRDGLDQGIFVLPDNSLNYHAVLDLAMDVAKAMLHLHRQGILHSDLKSRNVMLKSTGDGVGVTAKVGDFGLSVKMDSTATHMSNMFQGTLTHMAPEVMLHGRISKAADVYSFGILLWEIYTGGHPFKGMPRALLGHQVTQEDRRPLFPPDTPPAYKGLTEWCWNKDPDSRPSLVEILASLKQQRQHLGGQTAAVRRTVAVISDGSQPEDAAAAGAAGGAQHEDAANRLPEVVGAGKAGVGATATSPLGAHDHSPTSPRHLVAAMRLNELAAGPSKSKLSVDLPPNLRPPGALAAAATGAGSGGGSGGGGVGGLMATVHGAALLRGTGSGGYMPSHSTEEHHTAGQHTATDEDYGSAILAMTLADDSTL